MAASDAHNGSSNRHVFGNVLAVFILLLIGVLAFSIHLFSFLTKNGMYDFWNWFDGRTWYPLGSVIGGTVYPGLTLTARTLWWILNSLNIPLSVETVCVFIAPIFSAFASWATYLLTKLLKLDQWILIMSRDNMRPCSLMAINSTLHLSILVQGCEPYAEDLWTEIKIRKFSFFCSKMCYCCKILAIDKETTIRGPEPTETLMKNRSGRIIRPNDRNKRRVYFGQYVVWN